MGPYSVMGQTYHTRLWITQRSDSFIGGLSVPPSYLPWAAPIALGVAFFMCKEEDRRRGERQMDYCLRECEDCRALYLGRVYCPSCLDATGHPVPDEKILDLLPVISGDN